MTIREQLKFRLAEIKVQIDVRNESIMVKQAEIAQYKTEQKVIEALLENTKRRKK
jgi:hypothetical protein